MVAAEVRLPTGDEDNLLGTGKTSARVVAGLSTRGSTGSVSVNGGYTFGGLTDEFNVAAGAEVALLAQKQLTVSFDVISQTLRDTVVDPEQLVSHDAMGFVNAPPNEPRRVIVSYGFWSRGSTTLLRAAAGAKYHLGNNFLLTGSVMFRLNDQGYQAKVVPFIGLERTWIRR
jgi:hypothetical protein